jgi:hypothetical protein
MLINELKNNSFLSITIIFPLFSNYIPTSIVNSSDLTLFVGLLSCVSAYTIPVSNLLFFFLFQIKKTISEKNIEVLCHNTIYSYAYPIVDNLSTED